MNFAENRTNCPSQPLKIYMSPSIQIRRVTGKDILSYVEDAAKLRIAVFREFPYLYDGSQSYEAEYLKTYAASEGSVFVLATSRNQVVGISTGMPLEAADADFRKPFEEAGLPFESIYYFGESVLLPEYRGQGIGRAFFEHRESQAQELGRSYTTFCAVQREKNHPLRPIGFRPLDPFWSRLGYTPLQGMTCSFGWKCVNTPDEVRHTLQFWGKGQLPNTF